MTVIEVRDLGKRFGPATVVDGLSFAVGAGTVTGFLGPNGAGKTTTLRVLLGLVRPTSGQAVIWGRPYRELGDRRHRVGAVLEASGFHPGRTVADHLRVRCAATGTGRSRVGAVLAETGMGELAGRRAGSLSLGERQRLALAGALLGDPELLILDEPANGLDPAGVLWLRGLLRRLGDQGRTVLVSSHILGEVAQFADRAVVIDRGRLVSAGPVTDLVKATRQAVTVRTPRAEALHAALASEGAGVRAAGPDRLEITGLGTEQVATLAAALGIPIFEMTADASSLEEAFLRLTASEGRPG
ncbi:MAG: export transporter ATP-binding protein [Actinomycetia bacterium]|nr:export transporter ATP-binding protein [Actinomycetes bacterium]